MKRFIAFFYTKLPLSIILLSLMTACSGPAVFEKRVKFGAKIYTENQVKLHLTETYKQVDAIYIWNPVLETIPYLLVVDDENEAQARSQFNQVVAEFNEFLTIDFVPVQDGGNYYVSFSYSEDLDNLVDDPATRAFLGIGLLVKRSIGVIG